MAKLKKYGQSRRPRALTELQSQKVLNLVLQHIPSDLGLEGKRWTAKAVRNLVRKHLKKKIGMSKTGLLKDEAMKLKRRPKQLKAFSDVRVSNT
ncbi:MAG: hypothetical protein NDJ89_08220 [Oligoflexia bacterium]|nr:hypothetical protein [Oligoflexia bacterium]